jgi:hypothetical protein
MEQSPSWEDTKSSASQEIPGILRIRNVHYRIQKEPATCTYAEPNQSSPYTYPTSWRPLLTLSPIYT